jgi:cytochrome c oxidase cbb3-type subunit III
MRWLVVIAVGVLLAACEREDREFRPEPMATETHEEIALTPLSPGSGGPRQQPSGLGAQYTANAYHVSLGKKWFSAFNCNGCHANGGGGSGPPLMDDRWIYGSRIENIVETIREGRPNGMPSFRGKITDEQIWQLAAYVLSMSGNVSSDVAPGRNDDLSPRSPENMMLPQAPVDGGIVPKAAEMPQ